jgi:hypothetical protein
MLPAPVLHLTLSLTLLLAIHLTLLFRYVNVFMESNTMTLHPTYMLPLMFLTSLISLFVGLPSHSSRQVRQCVHEVQHDDAAPHLHAPTHVPHLTLSLTLSLVSLFSPGTSTCPWSSTR